MPDLTPDQSNLATVERVIPAPATAIFDLLADPTRHREMDGSGTVREASEGSRHLALGDKFAMSMKKGFGYTMENTVVEFEEARRIAWCHFNRHRWRYELEPVSEGSTLVTETFDGRTALFPPSLLLINALANNQVAVAKTLVRLKAFLEHGEYGDRA